MAGTRPTLAQGTWCQHDSALSGAVNLTEALHHHEAHLACVNQSMRLNKQNFVTAIGGFFRI
jgi:hypothetical protein